MPKPTLADKLVVAISSRALFDLAESHRIYTEDGVDAYHRYQVEHENEILAPGPAFVLTQKLLRLNRPDKQYVEVILLSRNSADTGLRVFNAIKHYGLDITRAAFTKGEATSRYVPGVRRPSVPVGRHRRRQARARRRLCGGDDRGERRRARRDRRPAARLRRRRGDLLRRGRARLPGAGARRLRAERGRRRAPAALGRAVQGIPRPRCTGSRPIFPRTRARSAPRSSPPAARRRTSA